MRPIWAPNRIVLPLQHSERGATENWRQSLYEQARARRFSRRMGQRLDSLEALVRQMDDDSARARAMLAAAPDAFPKLGVVD